MNYLLPLIVLMLYLITALYGFHLTGRWQKQHKLFILYLFAAAAWSLSDYFLRSDLFSGQELILFRMVIIASLVVGSPILLFYPLFPWGFQAESGPSSVTARWPVLGGISFTWDRP